MTPTETAALCKFIAHLRPGQPWDAETPRAWSFVLDDVTLDDARAATVEVAKRERWIDVHEIRAEVRRMRRRRLEAVGEVALVPNVDPDNPALYAAESRRLREAVANGVFGAEQLAAYRRGETPTLTGAPHHITAGALKARDMRAITASRKVPE